MVFRLQMPGGMLVFGQVALVLTGLASLALSPPAMGRMLLIPVTEHGRVHMLRHALLAGGSLIARGPVAGSYIVFGDRSRIAPSIYADGVLTLKGSGALCGTPA